MSNNETGLDSAAAYRRRVAEGGSRMSPAEMRAEISRNNVASPVQERRAVPRSKPPKPSKPGLIARLFSRKAREVAAPRQNCCIVGVLMLLDRAVALDGLVLELGETNLLFRQGASFVFDRTGAEVSVRFGEHDRRGRIVEVTSRGYIVRLNDPISQQDMQSTLSAHGLPG